MAEPLREFTLFIWWMRCLCWTVFTWNRDTAVPAERNGDLQTLICVLVARPRRCLTLSNPVTWHNWMAAYLGYTLRMRTLFSGWPIMVNDTHTIKRFDECRTAPSGRRPKTKPDNLGCESACTSSRISYTHHRHLLLLLSPKADTHFTVPQKVEGWVDLAGWLHTEMVYPSTDGHPSWY